MGAAGLRGFHVSSLSVSSLHVSSLNVSSLNVSSRAFVTKGAHDSASFELP